MLSLPQNTHPLSMYIILGPWPRLCAWSRPRFLVGGLQLQHWGPRNGGFSVCGQAMAAAGGAGSVGREFRVRRSQWGRAGPACRLDEVMEEDQAWQWVSGRSMNSVYIRAGLAPQ